MVVGCFENITFTVSEDQVLTYSNLKWTAANRYASHDVHGDETLLEWTGVAAEPLTLDIELLDELGVEPMAVIGQLLKHMREGKTDYLVMGGHRYGTGLWMITNATVTGKYYGGAGKLRSATMSLTFMPVGTGN